MGNANDRRNRILSAAATVTTAVGAGHLTLDRVAEEAGVSKGGLLYHFPNKQALLQGMLSFLLDHHVARLAGALHENLSGNSPRPLARSLIQAEAEQTDPERAMAQALLAAAAEDPALLAPARDHLADLLNRARTEGNRSLLLMLATEGLRFLDLLALLPGDAEELAILHQQLLDQADEPL